MTDLVEQLRACRAKELPPYDWPYETRLLGEAADEIERLRTALTFVAEGTCGRCGLAGSPEAECVHNVARWALMPDGNSAP